MVLCSGMVSTSFSTSLTLHSEITVQGGSCDPQTLGGGNVIFHRLVDAVTADHQHMRTAKVIMRHIHAVLVFLGDFVLEEGGQKQYRTDRSEEHTSELQSRFDLVCR